MSFTPLGAAAAAHVPRRTRKATCRSRLRGTCEHEVWRPTTRQEVRQILLAARRHELATRAPGRRSGALGHVALEVLDLLANVVSYRTGRLEPTVAYMMKMLRRSRDAIVRALAALEAAGFMESMRRVEPTGIAPGERGPQVKQAPTARRLSLPRAAAVLVGRYFTHPPLPSDDLDRREAMVVERRDQLHGLDLHELPHALVENEGLAGSLAAMARHVAARAQRESVQRTDNQSGESL